MDNICRLSNGNYIGCRILKISEFITIQNLGDDGNTNSTMKRLINEFFRLSYPYQVCIELLLVTQTVEKQVYRSNVAVYVVVRAIDRDRECVKLLLDNAVKSIKNNLEEVGYVLDLYENEYDGLLVNSYSHSNSVYAVAKAEKISSGMTSREVHYYSEIFSDERTDFSSLISRLSGMQNSIVSFQLFPFAFDTKESSNMIAYGGRLEQYLMGYQLRNQIVRDSSAKEPYDYYCYYKEHKTNPLFTYNVLVSAPVDSCGILVNTVMSLLQGGSNRALLSIGIPSSKYDLQKQFLIYPWNLNNYLIYNVHNQALLKASSVAKVLYKLPYIVTSDEACRFFRPPIYDEAPSILLESKKNKHQESLNELVTNDENILLGKVEATYGEEIGIGANPKAFTRHAVVVGMSGYGKTTYMINLLLQFHRKRIPFLVVEPTKTEYRAIIDVVPE